MERRTATTTWPTRHHTRGRGWWVARVKPANYKPSHRPTPPIPNETRDDGEFRTAHTRPKISRQTAQLPSQTPAKTGFSDLPPNGGIDRHPPIQQLKPTPRMQKLTKIDGGGGRWRLFEAVRFRRKTSRNRRRVSTFPAQIVGGTCSGEREESIAGGGVVSRDRTAEFRR